MAAFQTSSKDCGTLSDPRRHQTGSGGLKLLIDHLYKTDVGPWGRRVKQQTLISFPTRSVSDNDMFVQFNARKGNNLQGTGRGESASLSLIP